MQKGVGRRFDHACILVAIACASIMFDVVFSYAECSLSQVQP
jgi:predicted membrane channel-forming protein YqfA (hemolysin III family)